MVVHGSEKFFVQKQLRQFEWAETVQTVSFCTVDVIRKKICFFLRQVVKGCSLFADISDILMILFTTALLPEGIRITVENGRPPAFYRCDYSGRSAHALKRVQRTGIAV